MKLFLATAALATVLAVPAFAESGVPSQDNESSTALQNQAPGKQQMQQPAGAKAKASGTVGAASSSKDENNLQPEPTGKIKNDDHDLGKGSGGQ